MKIANPIKKIDIANKLGQIKYSLLIPMAITMLGIVTPVQATVTPNKKILVRNNTHFNNFDNLILKVDVPSYDMLGDYRFIKIFDTNGDVLFLGEVSPNEIFSLPVNKLKSAAKLTIEIFSENAADERIILATK